MFDAIDSMVDRVNRFRADPQFGEWLDERFTLVPDFEIKDTEILRRLVILIAYSNNANADKVTQLVERNAFDPIFGDYSLKETAKLSAETLILSHWSQAGRFDSNTRLLQW